MIPIMTTEEFNKILDDTIASITETLTVKMFEYIRYDNVMHNFEKGDEDLRPNKGAGDCELRIKAHGIDL